MTPQPLSGRGALVTGGGRGIGAAIALTLAQAGARVVVSSRTPHEIELVAGALRTMGAEAHAIPCDVTDEDSVRMLAAEAASRVGGVDVLVNNAGDSSSAPFRKITLAEWNRVMAVNATGTFLCTREVAPAMVERKFGRIVNVASQAGLAGARYVAHYSAAKHAVVGFTRSVALELAGTGVTANAVCPGYVDTPMTTRTVSNVAERSGMNAEDALTAVLATTGQPRLYAAEEVARQVLSLCMGSSNGEALLLDGGGGMEREIVNPESLGAPKGFSHGVLAPSNGRTLFVAGQPGWDGDAPGPRAGFPEQFARSIDRVLAVVKEAGGTPGDITRLTAYVTDLAAYKMARPALGKVWSERFGNYYPAMALIEVKGLVDRGALVEIEATAVLGGRRAVTITARSFLFEVDSATRVATLTLNRPERLNALTFEVYAELRDTFQTLDADESVRAVVLTGAGRAFCSGGDVEDIIGALFGRDADGLLEFTRMTCDLVLNMRRCRKPVIAALNGTVAGAGAVIATACDFRIAAESAKIAFLFVRVGLSGADMGAAWMLPRLVGLGRATELLMTGEFIDARKAEAIGLYHRVVPDGAARAEAQAFAAKLASGPGAALGVTKRALDVEADFDLERALDYEARVQAKLMEHPDYREAYEAFKAKRPPRFA